MKKIVLALVSVLSIHAFAQMAEVSVNTTKNIENAVTFLKSGDLLGHRTGGLKIFKGCMAGIYRTDDKDGGMLVSIHSSSVFDLLGTKEKSLAFMSLYNSDISSQTLTSNGKVLTTTSQKKYQDGSNDRLILEKISDDRAMITVQILHNGNVEKSVSCNVDTN